MTEVPSAWGTISYTGGATGDIFIVATTVSNGWDMTYHTIIPWIQGYPTITGEPSVVTFPVAYLLTGMTAGTYTLKAFIDNDGSGNHTFGDVGGVLASSPVALTGRTIGLNITLTDTDTDSDGMPDWWEVKQGLNPVSADDAAHDGDGDTVTNLEEYQADTDPGTRVAVGAKRAIILITESGMYRVSKASIASALSMTEAAVETNTFRLRTQGTAVPTLRENGDVLFYGEKYTDIYTDHNAYILQVGPSFVPPTIVVNDSTQTPPNAFMDSQVFEVQSVNMSSFITNSLSDTWAWKKLDIGASGSALKF
jgi:biotin operon repressor